MSPVGVIFVPFPPKTWTNMLHTPPPIVELVGGHQNIPFRGYDYRIPYMVGKPAPNSTHFTKRFVKYIPEREYSRAIPSQNGDKFATSPPQPFNDSKSLLNSSNSG